MKRSPLNAIRLSETQKRQLEDEIRAMYLDERGEEIGMIHVHQIMDLFTEKLAPVIYNKALDDARAWYASALSNMDSDFDLLYKERS